MDLVPWVVGLSVETVHWLMPTHMRERGTGDQSSGPGSPHNVEEGARHRWVDGQGARSY